MDDLKFIGANYITISSAVVARQYTFTWIYHSFFFRIASMARPTVTVFSPDSVADGNVTLPAVFTAPIRADG